MKKLLLAVGMTLAFGAAASAEPMKMTDEQLTQVTAAGVPHPPMALVRLANTAIATNNVSTTGGSASASCVVGCVAINISVLSGNIIGTITQTSSASAGNK